MNLARARVSRVQERDEGNTFSIIYRRKRRRLSSAGGQVIFEYLRNGFPVPLFIQEAAVVLRQNICKGEKRNEEKISMHTDAPADGGAVCCPFQGGALAASAVYTDVAPTAWRAGKAARCAERRRTVEAGAGASTFGPDATLTRAMTSDDPRPHRGHQHRGVFRHRAIRSVQAGQWYSPYVRWATERAWPAATQRRLRPERPP